MTRLMLILLNGIHALPWRMLASAVDDDPTQAYYQTGGPPAMPHLSTGAVIFITVLSIAVSVLFGLWAKARAEALDTNPWVAFWAGFFLLYLGVRMVAWFKWDRVFYVPRAKHGPQLLRSEWRKILKSGSPWPPGQSPPPDLLPPGYAQPMPPVPAQELPPGVTPASDVPADSSPMQTSVAAQPGSAAPAPYAAAAPGTRALQVDAYGFAICPTCGLRTKTGRKACSSCGAPLPK